MIYFLIPSYNDSSNFLPLLQNISKNVKKKKKIVIVDDGSTDNTQSLVHNLSKKYSVTRIGYAKNHGPGYAFKYGFNYLIPKIKSNDVVITMEADNTTDYQIIKKMIEKTSKYDVILASPYAKEGAFLGIGLERKLLSAVANFLDENIFRIENVKTYSSFFRAYTSNILKKLLKTYGKNFISENGFSAVVELLIKLNKIDAKISEVPAVTDWTHRKGKSKMKITKTILRHLAIYKSYILGKYN